MRAAPETTFTVILVESHLERNMPPAPLWLAYQGPPEPSLVAQWRWYQHRWPIESAIRFRKERLHWNLPRFQQAAPCDRWSQLGSLAQWHLFLARPLVPDRPLPWQCPQRSLTPGRVLQGLGGVFARIGTPATSPQRRGKSAGWPKGRPRPRPRRHAVFKKGRDQRQRA